MPQPLRKADPVLFAALAIDTAIAVLDSFTSVVLLSLLVFGPLVAATRATTRQTNRPRWSAERLPSSLAREVVGRALPASLRRARA